MGFIVAAQHADVCCCPLTTAAPVSGAGNIDLDRADRGRLQGFGKFARQKLPVTGPAWNDADSGFLEFVGGPPEGGFEVCLDLFDIFHLIAGPDRPAKSSVLQFAGSDDGGQPGGWFGSGGAGLRPDQRRVDAYSDLMLKNGHDNSANVPCAAYSYRCPHWQVLLRSART